MVQQGSITVDGVSLTVFDLHETTFDIHLIPRRVSLQFYQIKSGRCSSLRNRCTF